ncbi:MAG: chromophore lyase CpcT/CpeT [Myxococcota bacterium]
MTRTFKYLSACLLCLPCVACGSSDEDDTTPSKQDAGLDANQHPDVVDQDASEQDVADAGTDTGMEASADVAAEVSAEAGTQDAAAMLAAYLAGRFDSEAQSQQDYSYYPIQLIMCPVDMPDVGERVLYVEQAVMSSPNQPYRQRLYVVEPLDPPATRAVSKVYELHNPGQAVGWCDDLDSLSLTAADVSEKEGCGVEMEWMGDHFEGGTVGTDCVSTHQGASYTTSEVVITDEQLTSWDRGYDDQGNQVWGATKGPYVFDRKTPLELP